MIFRNWVLQNFPFLEDDFDALTDYELFCKMVEYMKESLEKIKGFQAQINDFTIKLDEFQHYFDNLDIQEEVDNKLDEMAESGELTDIIAQYLQLAGVLAYDTISDMAGASNIVNGSICKTLGDNSYNDGKGAFYKVRTITSGDIIDNINIVALDVSDTLVAERILSIIDNDPINVKLYGVIGDGDTDDTEAIQNCINNHPLKTLYFPQGDYKISEPLYITQTNEKFVNLKLDKYAKIFTEEEIDSILEVGFDKTDGEYDRYSDYGYITIEGGIFDSSNTQKCINLNSSCQLTRLINTNIINIKNYGLYLTKDTDSGSTSGDVKVINCYFDGEGSNTDDTSTAIYVESYDNEFMNIRIDRCKVGVNCNSSGNDFFDVHATMLLHTISGDSYTTAQYNATIGFISRGYNRFNNCYADSFGKGFIIKETNPYGGPLIVNCYTYHWGGTAETETYAVYFDNCQPRGRIANCYFCTPTLGVNHIIYDSDSGSVNNINKEDWLELVNNQVKNPNTTIPNTDLIYNLQLNKINGLSMYGKNVSLSANTPYPLCILKTSSSLYKLNISNDIQLDVDISVKFVSTSDAELKIQHTNNNAGKTYRLLLTNAFVVDGITYAYLGIQTRNGESITNSLNISNINKNGNNSTYGFINMDTTATPITNLDTVATLPF